MSYLSSNKSEEDEELQENREGQRRESNDRAFEKLLALQSQQQESHEELLRAIANLSNAITKLAGSFRQRPSVTRKRRATRVQAQGATFRAT